MGVGTLRQVSLSLLQDLLLNLYNVSVKRTTHSPQTKKAAIRKDSDQLTVTSAGADEVMFAGELSLCFPLPPSLGRG